MDNLGAHKDARVRTLMTQAGATVQFLPPYSYDLNPIESAWGLIKKRIRKVALGDMRGLNNTRRAVSTDTGWTFTFDRGDVLGDAEDARSKGPQWAFVDQKSTPLHDGRRRIFTMRTGCAIYSFVTSDGDTYVREPGARVTNTSFPSLRIRSLHDPLVVRLADGRYRMYVHAALEGETGGEGLVIVSATTRPPDRDPPQTPGPPIGPPSTSGSWR